MTRDIGIVLLNWNSSQDTIDCLKSLISHDSCIKRVVVVDNFSEESELKKLKKFLPSVADFDIEIFYNSENSGFSRGNNIGIDILLKDSGINYIWILNNDTIIQEESLIHLKRKIISHPKIGMVGSVILYHENQEKIQTIGGGKYFPLLGLTKLIWKNRSIKELGKISGSIKLDYLMGCSILLNRKCLVELSGFNERFFVYGEDLDLSLRAKKRGWEIEVALNSLILHKDSGSTKNKKNLFYFLFSQGNVLNSRIHNKSFIGSAIFFNILFGAIRCKNLSNFRAVVHGCYHGLKI